MTNEGDAKEVALIRRELSVDSQIALKRLGIQMGLKFLVSKVTKSGNEAICQLDMSKVMRHCVTLMVASVDSSAKPLVEAPEFGDRVRDTDKEPYWIPGAFPTIFQNETGDLHNYVLKEPDLLTWGPHIMRSRGWHAQAHMTFCYWWLNMVQRSQALSAKKWYVRDNPQATGYTLEHVLRDTMETYLMARS